MWRDVQVQPGLTESDEILISADDVIVPPGQITVVAPRKLKGDERPDFEVVAVSANTCRIKLDEPASMAYTFKVGEKGDDDKDLPK